MAQIDHPEDEGSEFPSGVDPTGDPAVDSLLGALEEIPDMPAGQHVEAYEQLHDGLLGELNSD